MASHQSIAEFCASLRARLRKKGYSIELRPPPPLDLAMMKHGALNLPWLVAVTDASHSTDLPTTTFQRVEDWVRQTVGTTGGAILLFVYVQPTAAVVDDIQQLGTSQFVAGAHDLFTGRHWVPTTMGWPQELYDES
jgi:hypothetical protein